MPLPTIFEACAPRSDILAGAITDADFAADLAMVLKGNASRLYQDPTIFFANTHPTRGLKNLLRNVFARLARSGDAAAAIFRLDTNFGGGKTHALIALAHAARSMGNVPNAAEFLDPALIPTTKIRVAAFEGDNASVADGVELAPGLRCRTPWGQLAYDLGGAIGYDAVRMSDEQGVAPGAETMRRLIGGEPALILLDELAVYLRKANQLNVNAGGQLTAFLTGLCKAVEMSPRAALVFTLAVGKEDGATKDAYASENRRLAETLSELESVSARKATLLDPTEEDETASVLRRRLFETVDAGKASAIVDAYGDLWIEARDKLTPNSQHAHTREKFRAGYPLHPELMDTLTEKTATNRNFQRVRGMLRILARSVERLWSRRPAETYALHLHHIDPACSAIRQEILTRWEQGDFASALKADVAAVEGDAPALAEQMDASLYPGSQPYASYVARTIFLHSLVSNEKLQGAAERQIRYSVFAPNMDQGFVDSAIRHFQRESAYLDDAPNRPIRFQKEPNLLQMIRQRERQVDEVDVLNNLNDAIRQIFKKSDTFQAVCFPALPNDIEDAAGQPVLAVLSYEAAAISARQHTRLPDLAERLFRYKDSTGVARLNVNNVVFLAVAEREVDNMKTAMRWQLALETMKSAEAQEGLAEHQKEKLKELRRAAPQELALAIQRAYRHVFYPCKTRMEGANADLNHIAIEMDTASATPGDGQKQVVAVLAQKKLLRRGDNPHSTEFMSQRTPLKNGHVTTRRLRDEYCQNTGLPILADDSLLVAAITQGIEQGGLIYKNGDLLWGKGDQAGAGIEISDTAIVMTRTYALDERIWPRRQESARGEEAGASVSAGRPGMETDAWPQDGAGSSWGTQSAGTQANARDSMGRYCTEVEHEGVLQEALARIFLLARQCGFAAIAQMKIAMFDADDGFTLMGLVSCVPHCKQLTQLNIRYETQDHSSCRFEFDGALQTAQSARNFFAPQLRAAADASVNMTFTLDFPDGLAITETSETIFTSRLIRVGAASAHVRAWAKRQDR